MELNVFKPVIIHNLLQSIRLLGDASLSALVQLRVLDRLRHLRRDRDEELDLRTKMAWRAWGEAHRRLASEALTRP